MPKLIDKYTFYELQTNSQVASTLLYGYLGNKVSDEKKLEIMQKLSLPGNVDGGHVDEVDRQYDDYRFHDVTKLANDSKLQEMRETQNDMPGYQYWTQKGLGVYYTDPGMEEVVGEFEDGMRELMEILEENEKDLDLSDPNAQNHYQMLKGILKNSYEGTLATKMKEDPSYGATISLTAKIGFEMTTPEYSEEEQKYILKKDGSPVKDVLRETEDLGILQAMAGGARVNEKLQENISNGNTSRQELLYECEEQSKRLDKVFEMTEGQVKKLQDKKILQNSLDELTRGSRGIRYSVYDMEAKQDILKAGYPAEDISPMSAFYVQMKMYEDSIPTDQKKLDTERDTPRKSEPSAELKEYWEKQQAKINNMKEVYQDMQAIWKDIIDPGKGPLTQEKRTANLNRMKESAQNVVEKNVYHTALNQFKDRIEKRVNAQLSTGDKAMLAGNYTAMYEALKEADPRTLFTGSKQFKDLKNSVKELAELDQQLSADEKKTNLVYRAKRRDVLEKAQTYLRYKNRQMNGPEGHKHKRSALEAQRVQAVDGIYSRLLADMQRENPNISLKESEMTIQTNVREGDLLTPNPGGEAKDFDSYLRCHTGKGAMNGSTEEMIDDMAKVLAAQIMPRQKPPKEFDPKVIDKAAEQIKEKFNLAGMETPDLREALNNPDSVKAMAQKQHRKTYSVEPDNYSNYLKNMRRLYRDMEKPDGSSKEYQRIYDNVKKIAHLPEKPEEAEVSAQKLGKLIEQTNSEIFEAMDRYVDKNAKNIGVRDPKMLQVLSAMSAAVPTAENRTERMVNRIRSIKGIKDISNYEYIELSEYDRNKKYGLSKGEEEFKLDPKYRRELIEEITDWREKLANWKEKSLQESLKEVRPKKEVPDKVPKKLGNIELENVKKEVAEVAELAAKKKSKEVGDKAKRNAVKEIKEKKQRARGVDDKGAYL